MSIAPQGPPVQQPSLHQSFNQIRPSAFHTLPTTQQTVRSHPQPSNYYFGCHPQKNAGVVQTPQYLLGMPASAATCVIPQCSEIAVGMSNEELDKSDDLIYESIYDSRWRLMNRVSRKFIVSFYINYKPIDVNSL